jgi:hypothetical protein
MFSTKILGVHLEERNYVEEEEFNVNICYIH